MAKINSTSGLAEMYFLYFHIKTIGSLTTSHGLYLGGKFGEDRRRIAI